jgi:hypothetical protein
MLTEYCVLKIAISQKNTDNNPVGSGLVYKQEDCVYSSAIDYSGQKGLIDDVIVFRMFDV